MTHTVARAPSRPDAVTWVMVYVVLLYGIPSSLVVDALGSAGAPSMLFGLLSLLVWVLYQLGRPTAVFNPLDVRPVRRALVAFLLCVVMSYVAAMTRPIDGDEVSPADVAILSLLSWAGTFLVANDGLLSLERVRTLVGRLAWAGGLLGLLGLVQFATGDVIIDRISIPGLRQGDFAVFTRGEFVRPSGTATHPIEFGIILTMLLPFALHFAFHGRRRSLLVRWVPVVLLAASIALTLSRSAYVCAGVVLLVLFIGWPNQRRKSLLASLAVAGVIVFAAVPGLLGAVGSLFQDVGGDPSITSRTDSYSVAMEYFLHWPVFGRGLGTFLPKYRIFDNQYLVLLVSIGAVGTLAFLSLPITGLAASMRRARRTADADDRDLALSIGASIAAGAVSLATFDGFAFPMTMGTFFLVLGLSGAIYRLTGPASAARLPAGASARPDPAPQVELAPGAA